MKAKESFHYLIDGFIDVWIWITVGMLAMLGFFGRRMLRRWDSVAETHVPGAEIDRRFNAVYKDMNKCQKELTDQNSMVIQSVDKVHARIDEIFILIAKEKN